MAYHLKLVDKDEWHDELKEMQLICLPADTIAPPDAGDWWLAFNDAKEAVAFACLTRSARYSDCGYLTRAGVMPHHRGHGLQKRLIRVRERKAIKYGWNWLFTDTSCNAPSANNLIACGFKLFDPENPWARSDSVYWRKPLSERNI